MFWPYYLSMMSVRLFHSRDIDDLHDALTEQNSASPRSKGHAATA